MTTPTPSVVELEAEVHDLRGRVRTLEEANATYRRICEDDELGEILLAREHEIAVLRSVGEAIVSELDLDRVMTLVAETARGLIEADTVVVPMIEPDRSAYVYRAAVGENADEILGARYKIHVGMCGWVLSHECPLLFGQSQDWWMPDKTPWERGMPSALLVPLFGKRQIIGGLAGLGKQGGGSFRERDLNLLTLFANQVSIAIENARLFGELQRLIGELEDRVELRTRELRETNRDMEAFSYSVSHDLRAPLISMLGFAEILREDYSGGLDADGLDCVERILGAGHRMSALIDGLLQLSRSSRGELDIREVDLTALAHGVVEQLQAQNPGRAVTWDIQAGLRVHADERLLENLVQNLLGNAWKYTGAHDSARIELGRLAGEGAQQVFFVRDDGAGFDMDEVGRIFGAFQRLHPAGQFPGSGIGLATVQRIVHRHGGRIWAEGAVEQGATFYFTLSGDDETGDEPAADGPAVCEIRPMEDRR